MSTKWVKIVSRVIIALLVLSMVAGLIDVYKRQIL